MKIKAKKKFGQNFLKDTTILDSIIQSMPNSDNIIAEIGPGLGDLTAKLLNLKDVVAFEVDNDLCKLLNNKFINEIDSNRFKLICGDVLKKWDRTLLDKNYNLVANLPYYIATNIILKALDDKNCKTIMVMVQKEVAEKFSAKVGDKEFSALSVITELTGNAEIVFDVPPTAFEPQPKIISSILLIKKNDNSIFDSNFNSFLKKAFSQPRKKLIKNLSSYFDKNDLITIFQELDFNLDYRPHQLKTQSYHRLYNQILKGNDGRKSKRDSRE